MAAGALSSQACTTSTRFLSMGIGYTQIPTLARRHFVGWASPQSLVFILTSLQLFELLPSPAWLSGRSVLVIYSTQVLRHSLAPAGLWGSLPGFAFSSQAEFKPVPLSLRGWGAERPKKKPPKSPPNEDADNLLIKPHSAAQGLIHWVAVINTLTEIWNEPLTSPLLH